MGRSVLDFEVLKRLRHILVIKRTDSCESKQGDYENERGLISTRKLTKDAFLPTEMKFLPQKKFSNLQFFEKSREIAKDFWTFALNFSKKDYFSPPKLFQQGFKTKPSLFKGSVYPYPAQGHRHGLRFRAAFESWVQPDPRVCRKQGVFVQSNSMGKKLAFYETDWAEIECAFTLHLSILLAFHTCSIFKQFWTPNQVNC